ncbi:MAG TPA: catalase [Polyangia bacterium]
MAPSTEWREEIGGDEEQRFAAYAERIAAVQKDKSKRYGNGRAFHRKQILGLRARLEVLPGLPPHARQGLFAEPRVYDAQIRLSNGSVDVAGDRKPDIRGFGLRVTGVEGPGALGGTTRAQDFVLINREVFGFSKPDEFVELVGALVKGPLAVVGLMVRRHGLVRGIGRLREITRGMSRPFSGFATESFFSAAPIANGPYAVRVRLRPEATRGATAPAGATAASDWAADVRAHLSRGEIRYELQLQFYSDEKTTPIEDGAADWSEAGAPYLTVARLTIPPQALDGAEGKALAESIERATFDPWEALAAHRPLGAIMRARKHAYFASQKGRGAAS